MSWNICKAAAATIAIMLGGTAVAQIVDDAISAPRPGSEASPPVTPPADAPAAPVSPTPVPEAPEPETPAPDEPNVEAEDADPTIADEAPRAETPRRRARRNLYRRPPPSRARAAGRSERTPDAAIVPEAVSPPSVPVEPAPVVRQPARDGVSVAAEEPAETEPGLPAAWLIAGAAGIGLLAALLFAVMRRRRANRFAAVPDQAAYDASDELLLDDPLPDVAPAEPSGDIVVADAVVTGAVTTGDVATDDVAIDAVAADDITVATVAADAVATPMHDSDWHRVPSTRSADAEIDPPIEAATVAGPLTPATVPAALIPATSASTAPASARPRLHVDFRPAAARATETQAAVEFTVGVVNSGDAPARGVRLEALMLPMGGDHDVALAAFFAAPLARPTSIAAVIAPGASAELRAQVTLPRDAVQPIRHGDRLLFVPLVAFNVLYEREDGQPGQVTASYVVGRENRPPVAKMAPFRLDLGPRTYREVGQRVHQVRQIA